jgi:hypothetical protein
LQALSAIYDGKAQLLAFKAQAEETLQAIKAVQELYDFYGVGHLTVSLKSKKGRIMKFLESISVTTEAIQVDSDILAKPKTNYRLEYELFVGGEAGIYFQ